MKLYNSNYNVAYLKIQNKYNVLYCDQVSSNLQLNTLYYQPGNKQVSKFNVLFDTNTYFTPSLNIETNSTLTARNCQISNIVTTTSSRCSGILYTITGTSRAAENADDSSQIIANKHFIDYNYYRAINTSSTGTITDIKNNAGHIAVGVVGGDGYVTLVTYKTSSNGDHEGEFYNRRCKVGNMVQNAGVGSYCTKHGYGNTRDNILAIFTNVDNTATVSVNNGEVINTITIRPQFITKIKD